MGGFCFGGGGFCGFLLGVFFGAFLGVEGEGGEVLFYCFCWEEVLENILYLDAWEVKLMG